MALINDKKKYIFFHLFKCGGNSMRQILNTPDCTEYFSGHVLPRDVKEIMYKNNQQEKYDNYYKFTVVRNPFDWLLSTYNYIRNYKNHGNHDVVIQQNLSEFIRYYVNDMMLNKGKQLGQNKCCTIYDYISDKDGSIIVDYVGKFETLDADMKVILEKAGIPYQKTPFINVNPTRVSDFRTCYNDESRKLVEKHFAKDLEYFNYSF